MASPAGTAANAVSIVRINSTAKESTRVLLPSLAPGTTVTRVDKVQEPGSNAGRDQEWKVFNVQAVINAMMG